jgi:hypothetical protein
MCDKSINRRIKRAEKYDGEKGEEEEEEASDWVKYPLQSLN